MIEHSKLPKPQPKYQKYAEYKDSGVEWLGEIPKDWEVLKLKYVAENSVSKIQPSLIRYVGLENISSKDGKYIETEDILPEGVSNAFQAGDVLFGKLRPYLAKSWLAEFSGVCSSEFLILRGSKISPKFLQYFTLTEDFIDQVNSSTYGSKMPRASWDFISLLPVPISSFELTKKIANFLDHETAKIDSLIEKQQQLIQLLKEKRQAVISHAVTKGLDPSVKMKDSGVEWLGEVPEHWSVCRLKHVAVIQSGIAKGKDVTGKNTISAPMLRVANVQDGYFNLNEIHNIDIEKDQLERYLLKSGDVLMNEGGDNDKLGRGAVWRSEIPNCIHQNHVFAIRTNGIEPEWLDILTRASYAKFHFYRQSKQSTNLASISSTNIKETTILVPSQTERTNILKFLNDQFIRFDNLNNKCNLQVILLQERRTALISAAVTGKIDVRNWQNPHTGLGTQLNKAFKTAGLVNAGFTLPERPIE
jgi:type I restriction enzyme, S subunit